MFRILVFFIRFIYLYFFSFIFKSGGKKGFSNSLPTWKGNYWNCVSNFKLQTWITKAVSTSSFKFQLSFKLQRFIPSFHLDISQDSTSWSEKNSISLYSLFLAICPPKSIYAFWFKLTSHCNFCLINIQRTCFAKKISSKRLSRTIEPSTSSPDLHLNKNIKPWTGL